MLESTHHNAGGYANGRGEVLNPTSGEGLGSPKSAIARRWDQQVGREGVRLLFFPVSIADLFQEDILLPVKQNVSRLVKEAEP